MFYQAHGTVSDAMSFFMQAANKGYGADLLTPGSLDLKMRGHYKRNII
mgnify:CR=1 FL=1